MTMKKKALFILRFLLLGWWVIPVICPMFFCLCLLLGENVEYARESAASMARGIFYGIDQ